MPGWINREHSGNTVLPCSLRVPEPKDPRMSVHRKDGRWTVRWRADGRQRSKSFALKREAVEYDRARQRDEWRDNVATPQGAVSAALAHEASFVVTEDMYEDMPTGDPARFEREIHDGYFLTIRDADAYRRKMPDADALNIAVLFGRYLLRDLTDDEIESGEVGPDRYDELRERIREQRRS